MSKYVYSYRINKACLWFASGEIISHKKLHEYFTPKGIKSLINEGFISILTTPKIDIT